MQTQAETRTEITKEFVHDKLIEAGYTFTGHASGGDRYTRSEYVIFHSGHMLIVMRGGMARPFKEDRLLFFTVSDMEKQVAIRPRSFDGKEDTTNYDYDRRRRP